MNNALEIKNLNKSFEKFSLKDISLKLPNGYIMGFIGPNGAGKTTVIKLILNMLCKNSGSVSVFGMDSKAHEIEIKDRIGIVMDDQFYADDWKLNDVEKALAPFYKRWDSEKFGRMLADFSLDPKKKVKELSRGMKMKLMIAAALSHDADLLILDEPTSGLDAVARDELTDILGSFTEDENKSVFFSTHITSDLEKIADYITFIDGGKIRYSDTKDSLMEKYMIVKGGLGVLTDEQKKQIIGYREHRVGFEGLAESAGLNNLPKSVIAEPCSLDEIIIRFNMEGK